MPAWGSRDARLLIVGLAPGMHGANRTGRPFTGDASGDFLFTGLERAGFATASRAHTPRLLNCRITNAVKCLPPENRPVAAEIDACRGYLYEELAELWNERARCHRCILALGGVAYKVVGRAFDARFPPFRHGALNEVRPRLFLAASLHPSRLNVNTGRLTEAMFDTLLEEVRGLLTE
ncbi:MAG: uracil-DNA glycosylase family protein [Pseudomonadales bacterium]|nr:uracil-DNA glycosylase family protein [Pseudomonadales bacterium]MDP6472961.1 uracil-DNA glycosylase family protein [Pseudomonadales bacterium]MDP6826283.1 uracil-DNA glycosylase family protein [Pseudomonadales bacterium]MDP6972801.1 uracil-DNA glycosylase family protein [Pseudomonadales bacterium]